MALRDHDASRLAPAIAFLLITGCASASGGPSPAGEAAAAIGDGSREASPVRVTACAPETPPAPTLGQKPATAIEVCDPEGERAYLRCLACPDGSAPRFRRIGSFGDRAEAMAGAAPSDPAAPGEPAGHAGHMVDGYGVACGERAQMLFFDMYHCDPATCTEPPGPFSTCATEAPKNPGPPAGFEAFPDCLKLLYSSNR